MTRARRTSDDRPEKAAKTTSKKASQGAKGAGGEGSKKKGSPPRAAGKAAPKKKVAGGAAGKTKPAAGSKAASKAKAAPKPKPASKAKTEKATKAAPGTGTGAKASKPGAAAKAGGGARSAPAAGRPAAGKTAGEKTAGEKTAATTGTTKKRARNAEGGAASEGASGKYVYCIIQSRETPVFGAIGIGSEPAEVHTVNYKDIAAVVSDTPIEVYDPTRENVLAHERVNETVMRDHTVIPMSFGTVFKTGDDIVELLRSAYEAFRDVLQKMQNKLEFGLKVLWDPDDVIREVEKEDENLRRLRAEMSTRRSSTYFARMQYGRLVDSLLQDRCDLYTRDIFASLRGVSVASRANKCIGDRMIMNAAFLVARDQEAAFDAAVKEIGARFHHLTFKYTGPWPPYNFVNIRLKLERAKEA